MTLRRRGGAKKGGRDEGRVQKERGEGWNMRGWRGEQVRKQQGRGSGAEPTEAVRTREDPKRNRGCEG